MFELTSLEFGRLKLNLQTRALEFEDSSIYLRHQEFSLLLYFIQNPGRVLSRTQILEDVWDRNIFCRTNTVDVHVSVLRNKIKPYTKRQIIKTIHCAGYLFDP